MSLPIAHKSKRPTNAELDALYTQEERTAWRIQREEEKRATQARMEVSPEVPSWCGQKCLVTSCGVAG